MQTCCTGIVAGHTFIVLKELRRGTGCAAQGIASKAFFAAWKAESLSIILVMNIINENSILKIYVT